MKRQPLYLGVLAVLLLVAYSERCGAADEQAPFVRLVPLSPPRIAGSSEEYPGGAYKATNLIDGNPRTEYSSNAKGTQTFVEFDFGRPTAIAGFRHQDRNDPATVAISELIFLDAAGQAIEKITLKHVNQRAGVTLTALPAPVTAQKVRWGIAKLGPKGYGTVGGAEIAFLGAGEAEATPRSIAIEA